MGHDKLGRAWIVVDKQQVFSVSDIDYILDHHALTNEIRRAEGVTGYTARHYAIYEETEIALHQRGNISRLYFYRSLWTSLSLPIDDALQSENVIIRALAMLDARVGKRRLRAMELGENEHALVKQFFTLRCAAEGIAPRAVAA